MGDMNQNTALYYTHLPQSKIFLPEKSLIYEYQPTCQHPQDLDGR